MFLGAVVIAWMEHGRPSSRLRRVAHTAGTSDGARVSKGVVATRKAVSVALVLANSHSNPITLGFIDHSGSASRAHGSGQRNLGAYTILKLAGKLVFGIWAWGIVCSI
jgi:hypothetical protein